jgi:arginyl-tRNA--protein-N-Asp/Glu arginylyltransferase
VQLSARLAGALAGRHAQRADLFVGLFGTGPARLPAQRHLHLSPPLRQLPGLHPAAHRGTRLHHDALATTDRHDDLQTTLHELQDKPEYYALYQRYQTARHKNGGMDNDDHESYQNFLLQSHVDTVLVEFREQGILRMVSVIDLLSDGISSVYTFFEPDLPHSSFGVYNVLWQIDLCHQLELDYVYLGYWIKDSRKMSYKTQYQPAQGLIDGTWQQLTKESQ